MHEPKEVAVIHVPGQCSDTMEVKGVRFPWHDKWHFTEQPDGADTVLTVDIPPPGMGRILLTPLYST